MRASAHAKPPNSKQLLGAEVMSVPDRYYFLFKYNYIKIVKIIYLNILVLI